MARIIIKPNERIALEITYGMDIKEIDHFLKRRDIEHVADFIKLLRDNAITPYLCGSVINGYLFSGEKEYNDIDILGTAKTPKENELVNTLYALTSDVNPDPKFKIGTNSFNVKRIPPSRYMGADLEYEFLFNPEGRSLSKRRRTPIDLGIISEKDLQSVDM
jgi:hypothetical protein